MDFTLVYPFCPHYSKSKVRAVLYISDNGKKAYLSYCKKLESIPPEYIVVAYTPYITRENLTKLFGYLGKDGEDTKYDYIKQKLLNKDFRKYWGLLE